MQITDAFNRIGIHDFPEAVEWVHQLPYGRNSNRGDYFLIFTERRGTCSTKHAALAAYARELNLPIQLKLVIYPQPIPGFGDFPEAHCFLHTPEGDLDVTHPDKPNTLQIQILDETDIQPEDILDFKPAWHRAYLEKHFDQPVEELLRIRERWMNHLSPP